MARIIKSKEVEAEFLQKELNRRAFIQRAALGAGAVGFAGCAPGGGGGGGGTTPGDDDDATDEDPTPGPTYLVGVGAGDGYKTALEAALNETVGRNGLEFIEPGDNVFIKVNSNSGDYYPYSTRPRMVEEVAKWCWERGANAVVVGDRSFFGDQNTLGNLEANGIVGAAEEAEAEILILDTNVDWLEITESDVPEWVGGYRLPMPMMDADHIINLPIVKTHFISDFTMAMKLLIGAVHPQDRSRSGNLNPHSTAQNKLYKQIAQINQHLTPSINLLDGWEAVVRGGPTTTDGPGGQEASPGIHIVSTDILAADAFGLAVLKEFAVSSENVHDYDVWDHPQITEAIAHNVGGITGLTAEDINGPTVSDLDRYLQHLY
jgi:uncharacterized protein (DUF362 family)